MLTKENLQEFAKKARIADAPFSVNHEGRPPDYYITSQVGDAKFIYRTKICRGYYNEMPGDEAELAAVVVGRMVYLDYPLLTRSAVNLPESVMLLDDKVKELNEQASSLVQGFYKKLEPVKTNGFLSSWPENLISMPGSVHWGSFRWTALHIQSLMSR